MELGTGMAYQADADPCHTTFTWGLGQIGVGYLKSCNSRKQRGIPPLPRVSEGLSHSRGLISGQWPHVVV